MWQTEKVLLIMAIYILKTYLHNLYHKYCAESPLKKISLNFFCKSRPKKTKLEKYSQQLVCLCLKYTNFALKQKAQDETLEDGVDVD